MEHDTHHKSLADLVAKPREMSSIRSRRRRAGLDLNSGDTSSAELDHEIDLVPATLGLQLEPLVLGFGVWRRSKSNPLRSRSRRIAT